MGDTTPEEASSGDPYEAGGLPVICPHCRGRRFRSREVALDTRGGFISGWLDQFTLALFCEKCGHVQIFSGTPKIAR